MTMKLEKDAIVLTLEWYIPDDWYGTRKRVVISLDEENGFKNASEANKHRSLFIKFLNDKFTKPSIKRNDGKLHKEKFKGSDTKVGKHGEFPTYIYCGAGPSYSCDNIYYTLAQLEEWLQKWEKSPEAQEKKRAKEYREWMKSMNPLRKKSKASF